MQCQHETPVLEIHGPRLIVLSNLIDPSVPRSYLTIKFSWMTNIWLLKKLSTLWQTTPAGWVHYFSLPCLPAGSSVSSFLFMLGNSLEAPCFKNNPLAATPGDGWIAGANGCTGLMPVEVAFCLESSVRGVLCFSSSAFWKEFHAWCVKVQNVWEKVLGMNCLQQFGQDVEKAFDTLAVFDTRPFPGDWHVMGSWLQSPNNGVPSEPLFFCACFTNI